jgi:hypothetical protein
VAKHYPQFESAADLRQSLVSSTSLARMKDIEARIQDAIVTQVRIGDRKRITEVLTNIKLALTNQTIKHQNQ